MARIRLTQPFDALHGTIAGQTAGSKQVLYSTRRSANVSRLWVDPANPQTTAQMRIRGYQSTAANQYQTITPAQGAAWTAAAARIHRENILNLTYELSGHNLYCMINNYRQIAGLSLLDDLPDLKSPPIPESAGLASLPNPTTLAFKAFSPGAEDGELMLARVSAPLPSAVRKARKNDCRIVGAWPDSVETMASGECTFLLTITSGDYLANDYIGIELTPLSPAYFPGIKFLQTSIQIS